MEGRRERERGSSAMRRGGEATMRKELSHRYSPIHTTVTASRETRLGGSWVSLED